MTCGTSGLWRAGLTPPGQGERARAVAQQWGLLESGCLCQRPTPSLISWVTPETASVDPHPSALTTDVGASCDGAGAPSSRSQRWKC